MKSFTKLTCPLHLRAQVSRTSALATIPRNTIFTPISARRMASNAPDSTSQQQTAQPRDSQQNAPDTQSPPGAPLPLPEPSSDATQLSVNGEGVKLDHLGPLVVNKDGSLSRIANWDSMAEIERQNTLRILGKRNQLRLSNLKSEGKGEGN